MPLLHLHAAVLLAVLGSASAASGTPPGPATTDAAAYRSRSDSAASRGDWAELEKIARAWVASAPKDAVARLALAQALHRLGRPAEAIDAARASIAIEDGASARFYLGQLLFETGDLSPAEREVAQAVALDPADARSRRAHAGALAALGRYADAAREMERASAGLDPSFEADDDLWYWRIAARWNFPQAALAHHGRGGWLLAHGRPADAAREYEQALQIAPLFADCHYHLGWARQLLGNDAAADEEYHKAIQGYGDAERPLAADVRATLAQHIVASRPVEAVSLLREAIVERGERLALLFVLGEACRRAGDRECAISSFRKVLASHEKMPPGWDEHAQRSLAGLEGAPQPQPEAPAATSRADVPARASRRCDHGTALAEQKRIREAIAEFEGAIEEAPRFGFCRMNMALALLEVGDTAGAERELRTAVANGTGGLADATEERRWLAEARFSLAQVIAGRGGSSTEAAAFVRAALPNLDHKPFAQFLLGKYCAAAGDRPCAVQAFRAALTGRNELRPESVAEAERYLREPDAK